ncbi:rhomboid family intramembrane serine protease [Neomicrococcus aestuarii]|uniref:Rhomboid family intramembrane serine protease n=1 Tax=Neomicrococcus aestuarii TaxID=556325 RepID=A0A1L2ZNK9_9MICC|nr:rhomboid family intramembrane serine protease [Neomicrococcus aestuarii]
MSYDPPNYGVQSTPEPEAVPVCPRHPDRVSYVRCQRCGRPTCGECQRPAAVGIQCVDCVAEAQRAMPTQRTALGGKVRAGVPLVTYAIIGATALAFLLQFILPSFDTSLLYAGILTGSEPWRMLTSALLHSQSMIFHILFNMYLLYAIGGMLEPLLGRARFLALYVLSAIGGSVAVLWLEDPRVAVIGASGAVFGLFGALLVIMRQRRVNYTGILITVAINLVLGFIPGFNISWQAHVGGLLVGLALGAVFAYAPAGPRRATIQWAGVAVVTAALGVLTYLGWITLAERFIG